MSKPYKRPDKATILITIPDAYNEALRDLAYHGRTTKSELIRQALADFINSTKKGV